MHVYINVCNMMDPISATDQFSDMTVMEDRGICALGFAYIPFTGDDLGCQLIKTVSSYRFLRTRTLFSSAGCFRPF